jgi:Transglutaminase-like superfamily
MKPQAGSRLFALVTVFAMVANIVLAGCSQKTAQSASQSAASPSPGGLGGIFGGSTANPAATASTDSGGNGGNGGLGGNAGSAAADVTDIFNSNGQTTPRQTIEQTVAHMKLVADNVPKSDVSVSALADSLPNDANLVDQYVRDKIRLDIYPGAMRGALGAILSRAANPTDKASLLAALLQRKGIQTRFARSTLTDSEIATLTSLVTAPAPAVEPETVPDPVVKQLGLSTADLDAVRQKQEPDKGKSIAAGVTWGQTQAGRLIDILSRRGIDVVSTSSAEWTSALRQHYWVQVNQNGSWVDLDPSAPTLQPGQHLGTADASFSAAALPDDAYQTLKISVIATFLRAGSLQDQPLLTAAPKVVELVGQPLEISVLPVDANIKPADLGRATAFQAMMYVGDREYKGATLDLQKDGAQLAEVRLEIQAIAPGRSAHNYRRWVFDRRSGSGLASMDNNALAHGVAVLYQGLVAAGSFNESFAIQKASEYLQAVKPALLDIVAPPELKSKNGLPLNARPYPARVLSFFMRDREIADALEQSQSGKVRLYVDRPDIAFINLVLTGGEAPAGARASFDIMENGMAAAGPDAHASARLNVARGIIDTRIEQVVMGAKQPTSTFSVFKAARQQGVNQWVLGPADVSSVQPPALGQQTAESLQDTLRSGQAALAVERPVAGQFGWWAVDPKNGSTVGRMSGGAGTEGAEESILWMKIVNVSYHAFLLLVECSEGGCGCVVASLEMVAALIAPIPNGGALAGEMGAATVLAGSHAMGACAPSGGEGGGGEGGGGAGGAGGGAPACGGGPNMSGGGPPICGGE